MRLHRLSRIFFVTFLSWALAIGVRFSAAEEDPYLVRIARMRLEQLLCEEISATLQRSGPLAATSLRVDRISAFGDKTLLEILESAAPPLRLVESLTVLIDGVVVERSVPLAALEIQTAGLSRIDIYAPSEDGDGSGEALILLTSTQNPAAHPGSPLSCPGSEVPQIPALEAPSEPLRGETE